MPFSVSILIPCYNAASYLPDLFEGIHAQIVPFTEIICYDDCSTDNTISVAESLGATVIKSEINRGPGFARNRLIEATACKWIHFHDADDLIDASFVSIALQNIEDENTQFLCNTFVFDRATRSRNLGNITYDTLNDTTDQVAYFLDKIGFASMGLYSKKALTAIGGFRQDIKGNEDPDLHVRLAQNGFIIKSIPNYLVTKLEHETSFSHKNWMLCLEDKLTCYADYLDILDPKYYHLIGKHLVLLGAYFFAHRNLVAGKKTLKFIKRSGTKTIDTTILARFFTRYLGIKSYYRYLHVRRYISDVLNFPIK